MDPLLKSFHLLFVALFLGNLVVTAVWKNLADRSAIPEVRVFSARLVILTDWVFVAVCGIGLVTTGILQAMAWFPSGGFMEVPWIYLPLGFFSLSGLIWALDLLPIEYKQRTLAVQALETGILPPEYARLSLRWNLLGALATPLIVATLFVMVFKPQPS